MIAELKHQTVAQLVQDIPDAYTVFLQHDIDFCCGGSRRLNEACETSGVSSDLVEQELLKVQQTQESSEFRTKWSERSPIELIDHILVAYHEPLNKKIPFFISLLEKVVNAHAENHGEMLLKLRDTVTNLVVDLSNHMHKEESILFPRIVSELQSNLAGPINVMESEHESAGEALETIKSLTDRFTPPEDACDTFRLLYRELNWLDVELRKHIYLENSILFPMVLQTKAS